MMCIARKPTEWTLAALLLFLCLGVPAAHAQSAALPVPATQPLSAADVRQLAHDEAQHIGDAPDNAPPLATDLSPALTPNAVTQAIRKVADWQLARAQPYFNQQWTYGVLYTGFMAASEATGDPKYRDALLAMGQKFQWQLASRSHEPNANDQCIGQTYLDLSLERHDPQMLAPTRAALDRILAADARDLPPNPQARRIPWWWCDALYMAPPVWIRVYKATGDPKYLDDMNRQWWACSDLLYDPQEHLFSRDASYLHKTEANGQKMFWSRGNGWVMGGLARILPDIPKNFPDRPKYIAQFQQMAARIITLQGPDGLWRAGLLDPGAYDLPENSGSAFFTYALAWGINAGLLDRATYQPVVARAWAGLLSHVYADGRLGCIQPTGSAPARFPPTASAVYGVGAFLLAGSEVHRLALTRTKARHHFL
jgi:unsaturated rhamnogalacturonyl hydrolase